MRRSLNEIVPSLLTNVPQLHKPPARDPFRRSTRVPPVLNAAADRIADPANREELLEWLEKRRVPERARQDIVAETFYRAVTAKNPPPVAEEDGVWLRQIARRVIAAVCKYNADHPLEAVDDEAFVFASNRGENAAEIRDWLEQQYPDDDKGQRTFECVLRHADGAPITELADEHGVSKEGLFKAVQRMREALRQRWLEDFGPLLLLLLVASVTWLRVPGPRPRTTPATTPDTGETAETVTDTKPIERPVTTSPPPEASALRERAVSLCDAGQYTACIRALDSAAALDPAGDANPDVQSMRASAKDAQKASGAKGPR